MWATADESDVPVGINIWQGQPVWRYANDAAEAATVGEVAALASVPVAAELATTSAGDVLFARGTGLLNANDYVRLGWAWYSYTISGLSYGGFTYFGLRIGTWHVSGP